MMISNWKKNFGLHDLYENIPALSGLIHTVMISEYGEGGGGGLRQYQGQNKLKLLYCHSPVSLIMSSVI